MRKLPTTTLMLVGILVLGAFFRFYDLSVLPPGLYPDEAMNGTNVLEAIHSGNFRIFYPDNNGREGLFINIQALSVWLFGNEPWALRVVSALFGTLTIFGVYLLAKELFADTNQQIQKSKVKSQNDNSKFKMAPTKWATKLLHFAFYILHWRRELPKLAANEKIALLTSFFLATSYWHLNFSRIGFRAITVPFFASFGIYWLLKGLRTGKISSIALAGIFIGLGFHTYIAFRFMPFILAAPIIWYLRKWYKNKNLQPTTYNLQPNHCIPCAVVLFLFITFVAALPIGLYFLQNPADFFGRGGQVSVFAAERPLYEFIKSNLITLQMFFWIGDCNPRHNLACRSELHPIVAIFFIIGLLLSAIALIRPTRNDKFLISNVKSNPNDQISDNLKFEFRNLLEIRNWKLEILSNRLMPIFLFTWMLFMSLPAMLTTEGLPHALRAIGMIPPVMILAGIGAYGSYAYLQNILAGYAASPRFAERTHQIGRIQKEMLTVFLLLLAAVAFATYRAYFVQFEKARATYSAFRVDLLNMARYVDSLPEGTHTYVLANYPDTRYGIPIEAEVIQYITDTARGEDQRQQNIFYLLPEELPRIQQSLTTGAPTELIPMNAREKGGVKGLLAQFPELKLEVMDNFAVLRNYTR